MNYNKDFHESADIKNLRDRLEKAHLQIGYVQEQINVISDVYLQSTTYNNQFEDPKTLRFTKEYGDLSKKKELHLNTRGTVLISLEKYDPQFAREWKQKHRI